MESFNLSICKYFKLDLNELNYIIKNYDFNGRCHCPTMERITWHDFFPDYDHDKQDDFDHFSTEEYAVYQCLKQLKDSVIEWYQELIDSSITIKEAMGMPPKKIMTLWYKLLNLLKNWTTRFDADNIEMFLRYTWAWCNGFKRDGCFHQMKDMSYNICLTISRCKINSETGLSDPSSVQEISHTDILESFNKYMGYHLAKLYLAKMTNQSLYEMLHIIKSFVMESTSTWARDNNIYLYDHRSN